MKRLGGVLCAAVALLSACSRPDDRTADGAVRAFAAAASRGDAQLVASMLDDRTLERLRVRAREASDLAGGGVDLTPVDLLAVGFEPPRMEIAKTEVRAKKHGEAIVRVSGSDGPAVDVRLRSRLGRWKIVLDL